MRKMVHSSPAQIVRLGSMCMKLGLSIEMRMKRMSKLFADIRSRVDYLTWGEAERYRTMQAEMDKLVLEMEHALKYYESCGEEADPEYQIAQRFIKALTSYRAWKVRNE